MRLALLQFAPRLGQVDRNLDAIRKYLLRSRADLTVLPELATTGYNFLNRRQMGEVAESTGGRSFAVFEKLAVTTGGAIVWGMAERSGKKLYNSAVLTTPEGDHHIYRKTHLFFREKILFDPGNTGFKVFAWRGVRIGMMICFDWIFPEAARSLALGRAQLVCHPANLVMPYCQDAMVTRSLENRLFCATANRVGREKRGRYDFTFTGGSQVTNPLGERILRFSGTEQGVKAIKVDPKTADTKTVNRLNDLFADRRVRYYARQGRRCA